MGVALKARGTPTLRDGQRVLIIRPSAIGDIVMASGLLASLRRTWPRLRITWLIEPPAQVLLENHPGLDALVMWPKGQWKRLVRTGRWLELMRVVRAFAAELRRHRFDLAIDAQGLLRSRALAYLSGAPQRLGLNSREPGRWLMTQVIDRGPRTRVMGSEYRHLAQALGARSDAFEPRLGLAPTAWPRAQAILKTAGLCASFAVFCPFTTRPQKHWFEERWSELAASIQRQLGLTSVLLGAQADRAAAARIIRDAPPGSLCDLTGLTGLAEAAAIVSHAELVVGVDTGLTHMASAFGRPCVALFGATCPYLYTSSPLTRVLYFPLDCSPCRRRPICQKRYECMRQLTTSAVMQAARELTASLKENHAHRAP